VALTTFYRKLWKINTVISVLPFEVCRLENIAREGVVRSDPV
jgi:hypothetical protein